MRAKYGCRCTACCPTRRRRAAQGTPFGTVKRCAMGPTTTVSASRYTLGIAHRLGLMGWKSTASEARGAEASRSALKTRIGTLHGRRNSQDQREGNAHATHTPHPAVEVARRRPSLKTRNRQRPARSRRLGRRAILS